MGAAPSKSKDLSLRNILIFVLYSGVLIIMFVLLAKRQIKRMRLRYDTNFETRQVMGFPKHYRNWSICLLPRFTVNPQGYDSSSLTLFRYGFDISLIDNI